MPNNQDTLVDKLEDIGDAIRAKTGKSDKLTLSQMPTEIGSISGGGGDDKGIDGYMKAWYKSSGQTFERAIEIDGEITSALYPSAYGIPAFDMMNMPKPVITSISAPNLTYLPAYFLTGPQVVKPFTFPQQYVISLPNVTYADGLITQYIGSSSNPLSRLELDSCDSNKNSSLFKGSFIDSVYMPKWKTRTYRIVEMGALTTGWVKNWYFRDLTTIGGSTTNNATFWQMEGIEKLVIDNETPPTLNSYLTFYAHNNSSNRFYNGSAKIYVPRAALSAYENATNWSVYYAAGNILAIEDSEADLKGLFPALDEKMGW